MLNWFGLDKTKLVKPKPNYYQLLLVNETSIAWQCLLRENVVELQCLVGTDNSSVSA